MLRAPHPLTARDGVRRMPARALFALLPGEAWAVAGLAALVWLSIYRARLVDETYGRYNGCAGCLDVAVWANDALLAWWIVAMVAVARIAAARWMRALFAAVIAAALAAYVADIVVFRLLSQRLLLADVLHFAGDGSSLATVVRPWLAHEEGARVAFMASVACVGLGLGTARTPLRALRPAGWAALALALLAFGVKAPRAEYLYDVALQNLWQANRELDASRPYGIESWRRYRGFVPPATTCEPGLVQRPSVVVVVVESLSSYHSRLFSGLDDYTPRLDRLAREGSYFTGFHANGYSTEGGLIALLTGAVPIPTAGRNGSTLAFTRVQGDFHRWLAARGYSTAFFTSGDLSIGHRAEWLGAIGIAHAEGASHPFYDGMPRAAFGAAEDAALVDRFLQWHAREGAARPFMATLLTVETHPPFASPGRGIVGEAAAIREADAQVERLARTLERRGFFAHGILFIVGDHRAMTPIPPAERERLGAAAAVSVPAIALGATGLPRGEIAGAFQQADLIPSLRHLVATHSCRDDWQGRFLGAEPRPARHVVHSDPVRRNQLVVLDGGVPHRLLLDGDDTRWLEGGVARSLDAVRDRVNAERIARMAEFAGLP